MVDGTATLMSMFWGMSQTGVWDGSQRGVNLLDTGAHFYDAYECADGGYISLGSIEPQFYAELLRLTGLSDDPQFAKQMDKSQWPALKDRLREVFKGKTRDEWCALMEHTDVCFAPVLTMAEAAEHPHNIARQMIVERDGLKQPAPAPRFSRTVPEITRVAAARRPGHRRRPRRLGHPQGPHRQARRGRRRRRQLTGPAGGCGRSAGSSECFVRGPPARNTRMPSAGRRQPSARSARGERVDRLVERAHGEQPHRAGVEAGELVGELGREQQHVGADVARRRGLGAQADDAPDAAVAADRAGAGDGPARARSSPAAAAYVTRATIRPCDAPSDRSRYHAPGRLRARRPPTATSSDSTGDSMTSTRPNGSAAPANS